MVFSILHGDDLRFHIIGHGLILFDDRRLELSVPVPGDGKFSRTESGLEIFRAVIVPAVSGKMSGGIVFRVSEMFGHLLLQHDLERRSDQILCEVHDIAGGFEILHFLLNLFGGDDGFSHDRVGKKKTVFTFPFTQNILQSQSARF
jgi:hypothetical protein